MSKANVMFYNNDEGVSPIIATLVLIVVAIVGAAAVGLIMGSFSSSVSKQANSGDAAGQASTQIVMGGSTTVQPLAALIAPAYMANYTGVKISVQGGGSGAGEIGVATDALDIGMASEDIKVASSGAYAAKYPNVQEHTIGGSGVVVIAGTSVTSAGAHVANGGFSAAELYNAYKTGLTAAPLDNVGTLYTRSDASGTADTFAKYISSGAWTSGSSIVSAGFATGEGSNSAMLTAVEGDAHGLGYVDYGFVGATVPASIQVLALQDGAAYVPGAASGASTSTLHTAIKTALKSYFNGATSSTSYPIGMVRPLNLLTNGAPTTMEQSIINFFEQPQNEWAFQQCGYDSMADIGV